MYDELIPLGTAPIPCQSSSTVGYDGGFVVSLVTACRVPTGSQVVGHGLSLNFWNGWSVATLFEFMAPLKKEHIWKGREGFWTD